MNFKLRPYQTELIEKTNKSLFHHQHVILQSPGGTGKSKVLITIANRANKKNRTVLIMTTFQKVYNQLADESSGIKIGDGIKWLDIEEGKTYVASVQTLAKRPKIIDQFNNLKKEVLVIIDEVHVSTCKSVLDKLTNRMTIGLTATPHYPIARHLPTYFNDIVCANDVQWFIDNGYLCDYQHIIRKSGRATNNIKKVGGDFSQQEQRKFFGTEEHYKELFKDLNSIPFNKCMLFTASIEHAEEVYNRMSKEGYKCSIYHSKTENSAYEIAKFDTLDETNIMISVGALAVGYDNPRVDCIVLYRATTSLALYLQMMFRADRPKDGMFFWCLDYGLNGERHKPYNYSHDWSTMWKSKPKKVKESVGGVKICPNCDSMIAVSAKVCKFCGELIPEKAKVKDVGISEDITNKKALLTGKKISELTQKELALFANLYNKKQFAIRVAKHNEQKHPGWINDFAKFMGYKSGWIFQQKKFINNETISFKDYLL